MFLEKVTEVNNNINTFVWVTLGLALLITGQALAHIMVTVNIFPETGQTLPLISRGGSSLIFTCIALGMILSVSRQTEEGSHAEEN